MVPLLRRIKAVVSTGEFVRLQIMGRTVGMAKPLARFALFHPVLFAECAPALRRRPGQARVARRCDGTGDS